MMNDIDCLFAIHALSDDIKEVIDERKAMKKKKSNKKLFESQSSIGKVRWLDDLFEILFLDHLFCLPKALYGILLSLW